MLTLKPALAALAPLALVVSACGGADEGADDNTVSVAAAFYPMEYVAERVAGERADITGLTQPGDDAHDLELGVQQTALVNDADLVLRVGGFQPSVDDAAGNTTGVDLDAAEIVDMLEVGESEEEHAEHADEEGHDEHADEDEHDHGDEDPHFWHDPLRMATLGDAVAEALAEVDADNAEEYRSNAASLRADLEALDQEFVDGLAACERDAIVGAHDSFSYLEKYGIHAHSIAGLSPDAEPTPAHIAELQDLIGDEDITTVFYERTASSKMSKTLAGDLDLETAVLDPIAALTDETAEEDYVSLMKSNLVALREANDCS